MAFPSLVAGMDFVLLATFGVDTSYALPGAAPVMVRGIFDASYVRVDVGEAGVQSAGPAVFYRVADLPQDPAEDYPLITIASVEYQVTEVQKDGQSGVRLMLHRLP